MDSKEQKFTSTFAEERYQWSALAAIPMVGHRRRKGRRKSRRNDFRNGCRKGRREGLRDGPD